MVKPSNSTCVWSKGDLRILSPTADSVVASMPGSICSGAVKSSGLTVGTSAAALGLRVLCPATVGICTR